MNTIEITVKMIIDADVVAEEFKVDQKGLDRLGYDITNEIAQQFYPDIVGVRYLRTEFGEID